MEYNRAHFQKRRVESWQMIAEGIELKQILSHLPADKEIWWRRKAAARDDWIYRRHFRQY